MKVHTDWRILTLVRLLFLASLLGVSCKKQNACYDDDLHRYHQGRACTADCPGVRGCDGKRYCNECEANRNGVRVVR